MYNSAANYYKFCVMCWKLVKKYIKFFFDENMKQNLICQNIYRICAEMHEWKRKKKNKIYTYWMFIKRREIDGTRELDNDGV
jgi:hypothetical protein